MNRKMRRAIKFKKRESEYLFIKDGEQWVHTMQGQEFKVAKAVYCSFIDESLGIFDDSWDVTYKDGDPMNCSADNLIRK